MIWSRNCQVASTYIREANEPGVLEGPTLHSRYPYVLETASSASGEL